MSKFFNLNLRRKYMKFISRNKQRVTKFLNMASPSITAIATIITAIATIALVWATISLAKITENYTDLLYEQNILQQDPILKISPNKWSIRGESEGVFNLELCNTGISDVSNIKIFEDYFIPATDNPLSLSRIGIYNSIENQKIDFLQKGESVTFKINFQDTLEEMSELLQNKKGDKYKIVRLRIKFDREIDKKEFCFNQFYIIAGHRDVLIGEDERGLRETMISFNLIKRILDSE